MSQPLSNLFLSIGKPVKDEYGRPIGRIISFGTNATGKFENAYIETSEGRFTKQPIEILSFNGAEIILISRIKSKAAVFCDQIPFIWRKDQALKDLTDKKKIAAELYQEIHSNFAAVLTQLRKDAQILQDDVLQGITRCEEELNVLSYSVLHLELQHEIGKINDDQYRASFAALQETIRRASTEKADFEVVKSKLANVLLGDTPKVAEPRLPEQKSRLFIETVPQVTELPEPPVIVYVKEIGKAGI